MPFVSDKEIEQMKTLVKAYRGQLEDFKKRVYSTSNTIEDLQLAEAIHKSGTKDMSNVLKQTIVDVLETMSNKDREFIIGKLNEILDEDYPMPEETSKSFISKKGMFYKTF